MKRGCISIVLVFLCTTVSASELSDLAASMQPGDWIELQTIDLDSAVDQDGGSSLHILTYAQEAKWNPSTGEVFYIGGDHNGGPQRFISYSEDSNTWTIETRPPWMSAEVNQDHSYDYQAIDMTNQKYIYADQQYDIQAGLWTELSDSGLPYIYRASRAQEYFPGLGLVVAANGGVWVLEDGATSYRTIAAEGSLSPWASDDIEIIAGYSPVDNVMVFGGGSNNNVLFRLDSNENIEQLSPAPISELRTPDSAILTVDSVSGHFLILGGDLKLYQLDALSDSWTQVNTDASHLDGSYSRINQLVATPIDTYGVVMFIKADEDPDASDSEVWLYKHTASSNPPTNPNTLEHDGPSTPEQISIFIPSTLPTTATGTVRYRRQGDSIWITGHPLHRIRPDFATSGMTVDDGFAWPIIGLTPGTSYEVEATITDGTDITVHAGVMTTRALPAPAGNPTKTISAGSSSSEIQSVFDSAVPGDIIQFEDGTYEVDGLTFDKSGTESQPIYIHGQSREGVILRDSGRVIHLLDAHNIVIESMTLQGSGVDSGTSASSKGIGFYDGYIQERVTIRDMTITGVDMGIIVHGEAKQVLVYSNTLIGNNQWEQDLHPNGGDGTPDVDQNHFWNDDGIRITGQGNVAFSNTLSGFGDSLAMGNNYKSVGVHFYRNDILMTGDDAIEGDYGTRNIAFYDNRVHNAMILVSLDPIWGGPFLAARNIGINIGRGPYKLNNENTGHFLYGNTVVRTGNPKQSWGWVQYNNGALRAWGYRNNIMIYQSDGNLLAMESSGQDPVDFTHNSWYPDGSVWWTNSGGSYSDFASAKNSLGPTTPLFSGITQRHEEDHICEADPFIDDIDLGPDFHTRTTELYTPFLSDGSAPKNSGAVIPGITDGFTGSAPDRGALIDGIPTPVWGDIITFICSTADKNLDNTVDLSELSIYVDDWRAGRITIVQLMTGINEWKNGCYSIT